jgi:dihydrofolate reductase
MKAIIAINKAGYIGLNNNLPWKSKTDFAHFRKKTLNSKLLVGYRTSLSLPHLDAREIIVYDKFDITTDYNKADWCIGGKATYEHFCDRFTELHISYINDETEGDTMEPDFTKLNFDCRIYHYYFDVD